jgi:probable poly-beta-1,6-N-acetyl-D-glucosamine export protein
MLILKYKKSILCSYFLVLSYRFYISAKDVLGSSMQYHKINLISGIIYNILSIIIFFIISIYIRDGFRAICNVFKFIGKYSYPAYMIHIIVLQEWVTYVPQTKNLYSPIILFFIASFLAPIICYLIGLLPYSKFILGVSSNREIIYKLKQLSLFTMNNVIKPNIVTDDKNKVK